MNAMKVNKDHAKAIRLFREAIELNPVHEDSRYYLGLASHGDTEGALAARAPFWMAGNGQPDPATSFAALDRRLTEGASEPVQSEMK